jgi:hypothetical protein
VSRTSTNLQLRNSVSQPRAPRGAPAWLQVAVILGLLAASLFVGLNGRFLWSFWLALAGVAFGLSYLLRRMVGDDYGRT